MSKRAAWGIVLVMLVAAAILPAWASDAIKISGTVTKQGGDAITVTVETTSVDVTLLPTTKYMVGARPAKREDLMVGDAVAATVVKVGPQWQASLVKITHPKKKP
jgi:hypothetical protein